MIGRTVAHYEIQSKLGAGAMGEVYLATDTNLGRKVALKFLPETLSDDKEARARLLLEAQNASLLNHPNVVTIHAIEHADGRDFIVMEYIEGQTLKDVLAQGQLSIDRIVEIGSALCEGLAAAHEKGIIHRDIKPDNIFITPRGHVKIADFGIARSEQGAGLTRTGMTPGTAYYMSPEQARGDRIDARSDLFSAGAVIYEIATGRKPFDGEHLTAVLFELLSEEPPIPSTVRPDLPIGFDDFIVRALAKSADARFQNAHEMAAGLRTLSGGTPTTGTTPGIRTSTTTAAPTSQPFSTRMKFGIALTVVAMLAIAIVGYVTFSKYFGFVETIPTKDATETDQRKLLAVLPFENLGPSDQEYFADGLTEEVITKLSRIGELGVASRTSVMQFKGKKLPPNEIAESLGVQYLMEGSVRWAASASGNRMRVTTRLLAAGDDTPRWSSNYDTLMSDMFAIQSDIAERVTETMHITLLQTDRENLTRGGTRDGDALLAYYQGSSYFNGSTIATDMALAIGAYEKAVKEDSSYLQAWARLSRAHARMVWWGLGEKTGVHAKDAKRALDHAVSLDPNAPETHLASGYYYYWVQRDHAKATAEFSAVTGGNEASEAFAAAGYLLRRRGEFAQALDYLKSALNKANPASIKAEPKRFCELAWEIGNTHLRMRNWGEAEKFLNQAKDLSPREAMPYVLLARLQVYGYGNADSAAAILSNAPPSDGLVEELTNVLIFGRDTTAARKSLKPVDDDSAYFNLQRAWIAELEGDEAERHSAYQAAADDLKRQVTAEPEFASLRRFLGISYAGLGRREDAIREGAKALELVSPSKDPFYGGPSNLEGLARIHTLLGDKQEAIALLDSLLSMPAGLITPQYLKLAPAYSSLKDEPRFEALLSRK